MTINWTKIQQKYAGQWVALKDDQKTVLGNGTTAQAALTMAKKKSSFKAILLRVPDQIIPYIG